MKSTVCIFTISSADYVYQSVVSLISARNNISDNYKVSLVIFCTEDIGENLKNRIKQEHNIEILYLNSINDENVQQSIIKYTNNSDILRWSNKSNLLLVLIKEYDTVFYIDNDIYFVNNCDDLIKETNKGILLTPHNRSLKPGGCQFEENFTDGFFNGGFVGANKLGKDALKWWSSAVLWNCIKDFQKGLYYDQKYLDIMALKFNDVVNISKNEGYNIAIWNINNINYNNIKPIFFHLSTDGDGYDHVFSDKYIEFKKEIKKIKTKNILYYTINDGNENYLKCLNLAYKSLTSILGNINFNIYTDIDGFVKMQKNNFDLLEKANVLDRIAQDWKFIGDLKFHKKIFEQDYDYFVYLDSDILWQYNNSDFIKQLQNSLGFIVNEGKICETDEQHTFSWNKEDLDKYRNHWGVNAGLFGLKKDIAISLAEFFEKEVNNYPAVDVHSQGKIEQSLFNKFIICNQYYDKLLNISNFIYNMYNSEDVKKINEHPNKIYHFMCFGDGKNKFEIMNSIKNKNYHHKICIVRPTYYDRSAMLQLSLEYQKEAEYSDKFETYIFVDPHNEHGIVSDYDKVITDDYKRINWKQNSGKYSWYDSVKYIFENTNYEYVLSIEDDVLISKDYLRICDQLYHDRALSKDDNILYFHSGVWEKPKGNPNKIVRSGVSSRSILINRKKFEIIKKWVEEQKNRQDFDPVWSIKDNDHMINNILKDGNMITIAPETNRHGHVGIYGWSANHIHGNNKGQSSLFDKPLSHEELYSLLKENCLSGSKLIELNQNKNPNYFWDFDPNINFTKLEYNL
jgi:hypothetical protein